MAPLRAARLAGVAPATIITAECDVLRDEAETYAGRLAAEGVPVGLRRCDGMVHPFFMMPEMFDAAVTARRWAVGRLRDAFAASQSEESAA
jgi:acetyl esterase